MIEALASENENFRDMCDELVAAECALATLGPPREGAWRAQIGVASVIHRIVKEIEDELQGTSVIPTDRGVKLGE
jgi:hypothetical protein